MIIASDIAAARWRAAWRGVRVVGHCCVAVLVIFVLASLNNDSRLVGVYLADAHGTRSCWFGEEVELRMVKNIMTQIYFDGIVVFTEHSMIRIGSNGMKTSRFLVLHKNNAESVLLTYPYPSIFKITMGDNIITFRMILPKATPSPAPAHTELCISLNKVQGLDGSDFVALRRALTE